MNTKTDVLLTAVLLTVFFPFNVFTQGTGPSAAATAALFEQGQPFEQDLVITAYYSPMPDQCCYVKGNYAADKVLNGEGHHGADGTAVYPGMVAAPPSYPFGTRIVLPGIGTVTVHDRGGAIQEWKNAHRLDLWAGVGEEGLARALAFGVQRVRAVVYPPASAQPAEAINLASLPSPPEKLRPYLADGTTLFDIHAEANDRTTSVQFLQERLRDLGYFDEKPSGFFGPATTESLRTFYRDMGSLEPSDRLTENGAALIEAAFNRKDAIDPIAGIVDASSAPARVMDAQRTLRFLGFYNGRTNGQYDANLETAVFAFQKEQGIVASQSAAGAGRIGPQTHKKIVQLWKRAHAQILSRRLLAVQKLDRLIADRGFRIGKYLEKGDRGDNVRSLQRFLVSKRYLKKSDISGSFGSKTEQALIAYQRDAGIIADASDTGAGFAGPATLASYHRDLRQSMLEKVREKGWAAI